ncbi:MAG: 3-dehydroquinate synthase [Gemmatimonadota bacterium]|nr:3-dehydroquinate synthase [Gemmatimonadota bacterium]MEC9317843.1 3-dehydroquinate synthase [Gemmatimonadota bacterium]
MTSARVLTSIVRRAKLLASYVGTKVPGWIPPNMTIKIDIGAPGESYPALIGTGLLEQLPVILDEYAPAYRYAVISDDRVSPLYARTVLERCKSSGKKAELYSFPAGEVSKTRKNWSKLTDGLLDARYGRDTCIIAVGGGVTGDLAGFVAATFLRGVPLVQVPTTYLAMIDAAIGGKVGVDTRAGKNLVGAFHPPKCVIADPNVLATLPGNERSAGLVEAFKHGAILDAEYYDDLRADMDLLRSADPEAAKVAVAGSIRLKGEVVTQDELENGYRQILNFGHTLGHALEAASRYSLSHGAAVAAGMVMEAELGERLEVTESGTSKALSSGLEGLGLETIPQLEPEVVMSFLSSDKKTRLGRSRYVLLRRIGEVEDADGWSQEVPEPLVREIIGSLR